MVYIYIFWFARLASLQMLEAKKSISTLANGFLNFSVPAVGKKAEGLLMKLNHVLFT